MSSEPSASCSPQDNQDLAENQPPEHAQDVAATTIVTEEDAGEEVSAAMSRSEEPSEQVAVVPSSPQPPSVLPSTAFPAPPPPPPIALMPPAPPVVVFEPEPPTLRVLTGNLPVALRVSHRASRWLLVILDFAHRLPNRLQVSETVSSAVNAWRPRSESSYAESYTSFFPSSGDVHIALLDTRSGERLNVWGEPKTRNTEETEPVVWETVVSMLETFLSEHSLNGADLGPLHQREKPWAVKTRRVSESQSHLPPTSMMDDEEAAIAAAIAASLAEVGQDMSDDDSDDDEDEDTSEDIDMTSAPENAEYTGTSVESIAIPTTTPGAWSDVIGGDSPSSYPGAQNRFDALESDAYGAHGSDNDAGRGAGDEDGDGRDGDGDESMEENGSNSMDISVPVPDRVDESSSNPRPPAAMASSVESLASSYMERLHSRFRSANDPSLLESRLLRQEQDAELAASLEADRRKIREKEEKARIEAQAKEAQMMAQNRLPEEPDKSNTAAVAIALRLPGGSRIMRRFLKTTPLSSVADLCLAHAGLEIVKRAPAASLRSPAVSLEDVSWSNDIQSVCGGSRAVLFIVHQ